MRKMGRCLLADGSDMGRIGAGNLSLPQKAHKPQKTVSFVVYELFCG
jgi:hypothetical protein